MRAIGIGLLAIIVLLKVVSGRLIVLKLITIQDEPRLTVKSKFKFNEVYATSKTLEAIQKVNNVSSFQQIPEVPIKNQGVIDKKYFRVNHTGIYIIAQQMDSQQFQKMRDSYKPKNNEIVVVNSPLQAHLNMQENFQFCYIRQTFEDTTGQERMDTIAQLCQPQLENVITSQKKEKKEIKQKESSHFEEIAVSSGILAIFTAVKVFYISYKSQRQSIV